MLHKILPPKTETVVRIPLSDSQRQWYKTLLEGEQGLFGKLASSNATSEKEALDNGRCIAEQTEFEAKVMGGDDDGGSDSGGDKPNKTSSRASSAQERCTSKSARRACERHCVECIQKTF